MGQQAAGQAGQPQSNVNEDAFRHFKDNRGGWSSQSFGKETGSNSNYNNDNNNNSNSLAFMSTQNNSGYNNSNQNSAMMSAAMSGVSGVAHSVTNSCLYTDVTRPNGPMDRASPMDMQRGPVNNGSSFNTHNLNQTPSYAIPPPPAKAEASTMMSTSFLKRNDHQEGQGGIVQYKIESINEEMEVSESYKEAPQGSSEVEREVQVLEEKLRCAKERAAAAKGSSKAGHPSEATDKEARLEAELAQLRAKVHCQHQVGTATYDEVPNQDFGMMTNDMPIMAPMYNTPQKNASASPQGHHMKVERRHSADIDMCSGFESHLTSISQQRPRETPAASNVGSCMSRPGNVVDELKERESWAVGSVLEVHSASVSKWFIAQLVEEGDKANAHMITVQFVGDTGQIMQKSMPRSDVQLAVFGRNTRQMPPGFQKVGSQSRPGQFSYEDSSSGQKYQTKELAWQNYYAAILKSEQAQNLLKQASLRSTPSPEAAAAERIAAEKMKPASLHGLQPAPTMSLAASPPGAKASDLSSDFYAGAHGPDPVLAQTAAFQPANAATPAHHNASPQMYQQQKAYVASLGSYETDSNVGYGHRSLPTASPQQKPQTMGDLSSLAKSKTPFPGYGQSFAVGSNAGYEAYLASQGQR